MPREKVTIATLLAKREKGEPITMVTGYDYPTARLQEAAGIDIILVGDSIAMTLYGMDSTLPMTLDVMIPHVQAVRRAAPTAYLVGDMPYMTYQVSIPEAIRNAGRYMAECGTDCIKLEGGVNVAPTIRAIVDATIPVMGHIGLTPQSIAQLGGFKSQGRDAASALGVIRDARAVAEAGACMILVEAVPPEITRIITERANIPIISIGAGPHCDGQLLIVHDMLGWYDQFTPRFVKKYCDVSEVIRQAFDAYVADVQSGAFPAPEHCYRIKNEVLREVLAELERQGL
jgi:3-methyl-2-oxobutanoate hydroxymethyltransferase